MCAVRDFGNDDHGFGFAAAADGKGAGNGPALAANRQRQGREIHCRALRFPIKALARRSGISRMGLLCRTRARLVLAVFVFAFCVAAAHAQNAPVDLSSIYNYRGSDSDERLLARARPEGTVTLYTSMSTYGKGQLAVAIDHTYVMKLS